VKVAFIGLGRMGRPMATNVARAGHPLVLFNRTPATADALAAEIGADVAASPREAAGAAEVVVTMLADADALRESYAGDDGAAAGLREGAIAIDMGTTGPDGVAWLDETVRAAGGSVVDAPVSGSTATATEGTLTIMAGGTDHDVERVRPVLESIGSRVYHLGATGSGAVMKLAVNSVIFAIGQAISESLVLAERAGIDRERAYEIFENSAVAAPMVKYRRDQYLHPESAAVAFAMSLAHKDLMLIHDLAESSGTPMPQADVHLETYRRAIDAGFGDEDMAALARYLRVQAT
jgi:3-hydroxyisobutyrate dehydrogenase-like beta-hydroxyacid dehydrogenase